MHWWTLKSAKFGQFRLIVFDDLFFPKNDRGKNLI